MFALETIDGDCWRGTVRRSIKYASADGIYNARCVADTNMLSRITKSVNYPDGIITGHFWERREGGTVSSIQSMTEDDSGGTKTKGE